MASPYTRETRERPSLSPRRHRRAWTDPQALKRRTTP